MKDSNFSKSKSWGYPPFNKNSLALEAKRERREKRAILFMFVFACTLAAIFGFGTYTLITNAVTKPKTDTFTEVLGEEEEAEDIQFAPINKVAYVSNSNVWVYNLEDGGNKQVTKDGGRIYSYSVPAWRNKEELSFAKCGKGKCDIQTFSLKDDKVVGSFEVKSIEVPAMRWSHKGDVLAYLFKDQSKFHLDLRIENESKSLGKFEVEDNRTFEYNDALYIRFSPNDENIMFVNTFVPENYPSITILKRSGQEILSLKKTKDTLPTFGIFMSDGTIYYKKDDYLYARALEAEEDTKLSDRIVGAFGFNSSPDRSRIAYWTYDWLGGTSTIWVYEIGTGDLKRFRDDESCPAWLDDNVLVSLNTPTCRKCLLEKLEFLGLSKVDLDTKNFVRLIEFEDVSSFVVDNF